MHWKETARRRRQQQADSIPQEWRITAPKDFVDSRAVIASCGVLSPVELEITNTHNTKQLQQRILEREWSCEAVMVAFCKRAAVAQQLIGCLTEILFDQAIATAKSLDELYASTGKPVGPFHGIPLSLKDGHAIEGVDTTLGWVGLIAKPAPQDDVGVQLYKAMGAVIYCKTNIPQSLMMSDSYNHVFGQSVNGLNKNLISGGSSGGEGGLIGAGGSIIGIGTDIGGSIRIPACLQGLYGLSPTIGRLPNRSSGRPQEYVVPPVAGPIARSLSSIDMFMEAYLSTEPWRKDPQILPIPWRRDVLKSKRYKIGYIMDDGVVLPHPPIKRAMAEVVEKLQVAGHEVFEWNSESHRSGYYDLWLPAVLADGGRRCDDLCKLVDEPLIEGMLVGKPENHLNQEQKRDLAEKIWSYQYEYLRRWTDAGLDAIIMPTLPWVGMRPKTWVKSQQYCGYTALWNLLNYTALTMPVAAVRKELDSPNEEWKNHIGRSFTDQFNHDLYDVELLDGMPVNVQLVTGRFGEEKAVGVARVILAACGSPQSPGV